LPCCLPFGKAGGLQILRYQGLPVADCGFAPGCLSKIPLAGGYGALRVFSNRVKNEFLEKYSIFKGLGVISPVRKFSADQLIFAAILAVVILVVTISRLLIFTE